MAESRPEAKRSLPRGISLKEAFEEAVLVADCILQPDPSQMPDVFEAEGQVPAVGDTGTPPTNINTSAGSGAATTSARPSWVQKINNWLTAHPMTVSQLLLRDKITFMCGLLNLMLTSMLMLYPQGFLRLFQLKSVVLLGTRWFLYRLKDWHYYMLEFCYVAILAGVTYTCMPTNAFMYKLTFALFTGVLTPAVVATRNAFVLHSLDKIVSLFQHLTPTLMAWLLRWWPQQSVAGWSALTQEQKDNMDRAGFVQLTLAPMGVWLLWATSYYVFVFVVSDSKVSTRGYATMFSLQTKNPKSVVSKFVFQFKTRPLQYAAYLGIHGACCLIGCLLNNVWWNSCVMHTLLVGGVLSASMWNGACYYMHVFAKKYLIALNEEAGIKPEAKMQ